FTAPDPAAAARTVFQATGRFHDPGYAREWERPEADEDFASLVELLVRGLR
ncbi:TetR/AcrR family transcriptional regulator, partial [Streptomyces sp. NPDC059467]